MSAQTTNKRPLKGTSMIAFPVNFTVVDIETTGLSPSTDKIIEISAIRVRDGLPVETFSSLLNPKIRIGKFITDLTGITNEMLASAPDAKTVLVQFSDFIGDDILVGHNVNFDINFLYDSLIDISPLRNDYIDTLRISRKCLPALEHHRLCDVAEHFGICQDNAHRALADCETTLSCFNSMHGMTAEKAQSKCNSSDDRAYSKKSIIGKEELHKALNTLVGILSGIVADGFVVKEESNEVQHWYSLYRGMINIQPFAQILPTLDKALLDGYIDEEEAQDILWLCRNVIAENQDQLYFNFVSSSAQQLQGMLHGLIADDVLSDIELEALSAWMNENEFLCGTYPFDELYSLLLAAKEDDIISDDERNMLKAFFANFIDTRTSDNVNVSDAKALRDKYLMQSIYTTQPQISFEGKTFCFTGESKFASRSEIAQVVQSKGAKFSKDVTKKTDYLVVGNEGNPCWAFACYGRKVEKAMSLRKGGQRIAIISEDDFWQAIK